jgi:hypothetical protein
MYCFANNLPTPEDRTMVEEAVSSGVGMHKPEVERYSVVAGANDIWQIRLRLRTGRDLLVDIDGTENGTLGHTSQWIEKRVRGAFEG